MSYTPRNMRREMSEMTRIYDRARRTWEAMFDENQSVGELTMVKVDSLGKMIHATKEINGIFGDMLGELTVILSAVTEMLQTQRTGENGNDNDSDVSEDGQEDLKEAINGGGDDADSESSDNENPFVQEIEPLVNHNTVPEDVDQSLDATSQTQPIDESEKSDDDEDESMDGPYIQNGDVSQNLDAANETTQNDTTTVAMTRNSISHDAMDHESTENAEVENNGSPIDLDETQSEDSDKSDATNASLSESGQNESTSADEDGANKENESVYFVPMNTIGGSGDATINSQQRMKVVEEVLSQPEITPTPEIQRPDSPLSQQETLPIGSPHSSQPSQHEVSAIVAQTPASEETESPSQLHEQRSLQPMVRLTKLGEEIFGPLSAASGSSNATKSQAIEGTKLPTRSEKVSDSKLDSLCSEPSTSAVASGSPNATQTQAIEGIKKPPLSRKPMPRSVKDRHSSLDSVSSEASPTATASGSSNATQAIEGMKTPPMRRKPLPRLVKDRDSSLDSVSSEASTSASAAGTSKRSEPSTSTGGSTSPKHKRATPPIQTTPVKEPISTLPLKKRRFTQVTSNVSKKPKLDDSLSQPLVSKKTAPPKRKRQATKSRKTVSISKVRLAEDSDEEEEHHDDLKNTDKAVHSGPKSLYKKLCLLCSKSERNMVQHFVKMHPDKEVFISRPSPEMMLRLKKQEREFKRDGNKINGICFFCEEKKSFTITMWERHLLTHTGEPKYFCDDCQYEASKPEQHSKCGSLPTNIFENGKGDNGKDYSLDCYACKLCNFIQINEIKMKAHLRLEHELQEDSNYTKLVLVPNLKK